MAAAAVAAAAVVAVAVAAAAVAAAAAAAVAAYAFSQCSVYQESPEKAAHIGVLLQFSIGFRACEGDPAPSQATTMTATSGLAAW